MINVIGDVHYDYKYIFAMVDQSFRFICHQLYESQELAMQIMTAKYGPIQELYELTLPPEYMIREDANILAGREGQFLFSMIYINLSHKVTFYFHPN